MVKLTAPQQEVVQEIASGDFKFEQYTHNGKVLFKRWQRMSDGRYVTAVNRSGATPTLRSLIKKGVVAVDAENRVVLVPTEPVKAEVKAEPANFIPGGKIVARFLKEGDVIERGGNLVRIARPGKLEHTGPMAGRMYFPGYRVDGDGDVLVFTINPDLWVELYDTVTDEEMAAYLGQEGS